ncbi:MAG: PucR family transcriptional regulator [Papillibacter sp.]|jgi:carbohydrate diacid regulator|nr:PucR family transcriptional regulator [Papillibacter sp.]
MSGRIFQSVIVQMKEATSRVIGVIDSEGGVVACNELSMVGTRISKVASVISESNTQTVVYDAKTFKVLGGWNSDFDYAVFVEGEDEQAKCICVLAAIAFNEAKVYYEEKHDKAAFIKNLISDNTLLADLYVRAKELRFDVNIPRGVFLIRQPGKVDSSTIEVMQNLFPDRQKDFIFGVSESDVVLIKELSPNAESKDLSKIAAQIENTLTTELYIKPVIGVGSVARHLRELAERYKEAQVAIEVGKVFDNDKMIIHYDNLGIGRIIYQLPTTLCEMFLSEVFKKSPIDSLDQETLYTINKFFENNLNVSETSRKLFVHRNTLVYRLEKIKKLTGLDLREFDHAIVFKVALMVKKYLASQKN